MTYRKDESHEVYRDAAGVPVERHSVSEERAVNEPVAYGDPAPYVETAPLRNEVVREQIVAQPVVAAPVRDEFVSDRVVEDEAAGRFSALDLATRIIWFLTGLLLVGLVIRFIFKATGANTASSFVSFVYNATAAFVAPFRGIFSDSVSGSNVLEVSTIVAIVVWALIAFFVTWLLGIILGGPSRGVREYRRTSRRF
ncbi:MAG: YggT family protein [Thermomicrobia bacterium]|nr:YggT family protein [Thermomicrobia bacterium]MCA1722858.1 YggT family protein [Thermomicrobia bacterium]